jgi:hypothetical protein
VDPRRRGRSAGTIGQPKNDGERERVPPREIADFDFETVSTFHVEQIHSLLAAAANEIPRPGQFFENRSV